MLDHVSFGTTRYSEAVAFYRRMLAPLGYELLRDTGREAAFGTPDRWCFFLYPVEAGVAVAGAGTHLAIAAPSRDSVRGAHAAAMEAAGTDLWSPRERPDIDDRYYGAMFHDLDGHRIEVMTRIV